MDCFIWDHLYVKWSCLFCFVCMVKSPRLCVPWLYSMYSWNVLNKEKCMNVVLWCLDIRCEKLWIFELFLELKTILLLYFECGNDVGYNNPHKYVYKWASYIKLKIIYISKRISIYNKSFKFSSNSTNTSNNCVLLKKSIKLMTICQYSL